MSAYNFRLHDAVIEALAAAMEEEAHNLALARTADYGELKYRIGKFAGLNDAMEIAEATRKKMLKE